MKKLLLLIAFVSLLSGCTQNGIHPTATADSSFRAFLTRWEEAQSRFINGDPTLWKQNASHRDDVTIFGAFGGYGEKGWNEVGSRYDWASSQYKAGGAMMKVEYINTSESGNLGVTVAIERQEGVGDDSWVTCDVLLVTT